MSPHGSKLLELIRYLANLLLTDSQRKKIKNFLARLQQIPVRLLGLEALIQSQKEEIGRLKSRLTILDGKLNIALYGMPQVTPDFRPFELSQSILNRYEDVKQPRPTHPINLKPLLIAAPLNSLQPKRALLLGSSSDLGFLDFFPDLQEIYLNDPDHVNQPAASRSHAALKTIVTTPMNALLAFEDSPFDLLICINQFQQLAPIEQIQFLTHIERQLTPGGVFLNILPNLSHPKMREDLYWSNPRNLRPYSMSLIQDAFNSSSGKLTVFQESEPFVALLFQKAKT
jgi:hypothetical protein